MHIPFTNDIVELLISLCLTEILTVQKPSYRILYKLIYNKTYIKEFIAFGGLQAIKIGLSMKNADIISEVLMILLELSISNIEIFMDITIIESLMNNIIILNVELQKKILMIFINYSYCENAIETLFNIEIISNLCILMGNIDTEMIMACLNMLELILKRFDENSLIYYKIKKQFIYYQGLSILETLETHSNQIICLKAHNLTISHFL